MAQVIIKISNLSDPFRGIIANVGSISGGGPTNIVPALALCRVNIRTNTIDEMNEVIEQMHSFTDKKHDECAGITFEVYEDVLRPPKPFDLKTQQLFENIKACANQLGIKVSWKESGGVCDGNILAAAGLSTIDTLGARGDHIHTHNEYLLIESLVERASLTSLFLMQLANS
jgi:glutamate carboxypeptidase